MVQRPACAPDCFFVTELILRIARRDGVSEDVVRVSLGLPPRGVQSASK